MGLEKQEQRQKRMKLFLTIFKFLLLLVILAGIPLYLYFFQHGLIEYLSSMERVNQLFQYYKTQSILIYIGLQVLQIVICFIPGQWLQFTAGYLYGFWLGYFYSLIGAFAGSVITYYLAKLLGRDAMHLIFGEERINQFIHSLNSKKAMMIVFFIFLIPGVPKDLCNYAAGLSEMKLKPFLIVSLIGRSPAMMGSLLIGRQIERGDYTGAVIIGAAAVILFILGVIMRKRVAGWLDTAYSKLYK